MWPKTPSTVTSVLLMLLMGVNSDTTSLKSNAKLEIRSNCSSLPYVAVGSSITLDCVLLVNNERVEEVDVIWLDPNGRLIRETRFWKSFMKRSSLLTIRNMLGAFDGNYTCKIDNNDYKLSAKVEIIPVIGLQFLYFCETQQLLIADHNDRGKITCKVILNDGNYYSTRLHSRIDDKTKSPPTATAPTLSDVHIQWYKNGAPYVPPSGRCHVNTSIGIVCDQVLEADAGNYTIVARMTSPVEQTINRTIVVEVHTFPRIHSLPTEVVAAENSTVKLTCSATGNPPPTYKWYSKYHLTVYRPLKRFRYDTKSGTLIISDVSRHDAGLISCLAENSAGGDIRKVALVVTTAEGAPFEEDQETIFSSQNDLMFNGVFDSNDSSSTAAANRTAFYVNVIFCFVVVFLCLLVLVFLFDVGCYVTRRRGVIAVLSNYLWN